MSLQAERLAALIEFCHQSARLRGRPTATVASHSNFSLYENDLNDVPGVHFNSSGVDGLEEIWLSVDRLHETKPPEVTNEWLRPWLVIARGTNEEPSLRAATSGASLIEAGTHAAEDGSGKPRVDADALFNLADFAEATRVRGLFQDYVRTRWMPWSVEEKKRVKAIRLYAQIFTLKQQLEGGIVEAQLELVWGIGIGVWKTSTATVSYPVIGRLVELALNPVTAALEVRPRDIDPRVELDWYAAQDNPGVANLEKAAKKFFEEIPNTISPFDRSTYEPLLRSAVIHLDANGVYWPSQVKPEDRSVPKAEDKLKVTDTWVLFARPRTNSAYLQDLERLKLAAESYEEFPPAVAAIVTDPDTENPEVELPTFRGISASYHGASFDGEGKLSTHKANDLYFPKPFNDEQVRIIQLLDLYDGVVAQGPPGTGKTHTIANVICHFLANGKRVLVTSMKDPALGVLQDQLPDEIKPLAISLLTSEQEGLKKFEHSILKIASEVQSLDRGATSKEIRHLENTIDALHGQLARIDWDISNWAKKNLNKIAIDSVEVDPKDAAQQIVASNGEYEWIPDPINVTAEFEPRFDDQDVVALRGARRELGADITYLTYSLPQLIEFPNLKVVLQTHQDLAKFEQLRKEVEVGDVPNLRDTSDATIDAVTVLKAHVDAIKTVRITLQALGYGWISLVKLHISSESKKDVTHFLRQLGEELKTSQARRKDFLSRPVVIPSELELNQELSEAISNLSAGKRPFGLVGLLGKSTEKRSIESIRILGGSPQNSDEWKHVNAYVELQKYLRVLAIRWNAVAAELDLPLVDGSPQGGQQAVELFAVIETIDKEIAFEQKVLSQAKSLFTSWVDVDHVISSQDIFTELDGAVRHHLTKNRLANVWVQKEKFHNVLNGKGGPVVDRIRDFINQTLGSPSVTDSEMQVCWSGLMSELSRVLGLQSKLDVVDRVSTLVKESGAPVYAVSLRQPMISATDDLLPGNWKQSWKLRRIATYLEEIDGQEALKRLSENRKAVVADLARAYKDVVVKRTWLKLAENASPSIRAALQAYLSAIQKIGKGTGKRAVRYRQDARNAASQANSAVPCWIMPHYRISESLPAELGCFDLVIVDEASQSDLTALPALLRAKKVLIVGDDKQVSPEGVGLEEEKIRHLMSRFLGNQVDTYRPQMSPERSIYDLFKVVYAKSSVVLKEHFRCVSPIIEYSKREFYNHELMPLRLPKASERLDPPLIDVMVQDGYRDGDKNFSEARVIVEEIKRIVSDERFQDRSIGVVSLLADKQAYLIWEMLTEELGPDLLQRHKIACGDARTFQGKERDIMFLSMVVAPNEPRIAPLSRDTYAQRFNVAASRARDRMYLVRSVALEHLSEADKLRRSLIAHFSSPFVQDESRLVDLRTLCESPFEKDVYDALTERGYWVTPQVKVGQFRIDMVVEGSNDSRLAVECDGDKYHGPDKWADDMHRQRILERVGWIFWRCFASTWVRRRSEMIEELIRSLEEHGIQPVGSEFAPRSIHCEQRVVTASEFDRSNMPLQEVDSHSGMPYGVNETLAVEPPTDVIQSTPECTTADAEISSAPTVQKPTVTERSSPDPSGLSGFDIPIFVLQKKLQETQVPNVGLVNRLGLQVQKYTEFAEALAGDPRDVNEEWISKGLVKIIRVEGPVIAKRACDIYLRTVGIKRMGHEIKATMTKALHIAISTREIESEKETTDLDLMSHSLRVSGCPSLVIRTRGDRLFEEITPSEVQLAARYIAQKCNLRIGSDDHLRMILEFFDLKRLTTQVGISILDILSRQLPHVDVALAEIFSGPNPYPFTNA